MSSMDLWGYGVRQVFFDDGGYAERPETFQTLEAAHNFAEELNTKYEQREPGFLNSSCFEEYVR